jgi:hypothetical protein
MILLIRFYERIQNKGSTFQAHVNPLPLLVPLRVEQSNSMANKTATFPTPGVNPIK